MECEGKLHFNIAQWWNVLEWTEVIARINTPTLNQSFRQSLPPPLSCNLSYTWVCVSCIMRLCMYYTECAKCQSFISAGTISTAQLADISNRLSHLPFEDKLQFAMNLGFTESEVFAKCQPWSAGLEDLLLTILLDWKRRNVSNAQQLLAGALMKIGHFQEAIRMDPASIGMCVV